MAFPLRPLRRPYEQRSSIEFVFKLLLSLVSSSAQHARSQIVHHDTKYGLRISFENSHITSVRIVPPPSQPATDSPTTFVDNNVRSLSQPPKPRYDYRLMPGWRTSYLWYDADSPHALDGGYPTRTRSHPVTRRCKPTTSPGRRLTSPPSRSKAAISAVMRGRSPARRSARRGRWKGV